MPKRAYRVYEKSEDAWDGMTIVFADTPAGARLQVWYGESPHEVAADAYLDLRARREPWADAYAASEDIPIQAYLENGWQWMCEGCDWLVGLDGLGGLTPEGNPLCERCATKQGKTPPEWAAAGPDGIAQGAEA